VKEEGLQKTAHFSLLFVPILFSFQKAISVQYVKEPENVEYLLWQQPLQQFRDFQKNQLATHVQFLQVKLFVKEFGVEIYRAHKGTFFKFLLKLNICIYPFI